MEDHEQAASIAENEARGVFQFCGLTLHISVINESEDSTATPRFLLKVAEAIRATIEEAPEPETTIAPRAMICDPRSQLPVGQDRGVCDE